MDVRFIDHDDGAGGLVGHQPLDISPAGQGSGRIVGIADVEETGIGRGRPSMAFTS